MQVMRYVFVVTFFSLLGLLRSVTSEQTCYDGPDAVIVNEDADVYIGVLLNMREMVDIPIRCGVLHRDAVELYESLRWYLSLINQKSGQVASRLVTDSFVPGIKLGLKIFDVCGDADLAERQLEILFPELKAEDAIGSCPPNDEHSIIGLIDFIGLTDYPQISQQLESFNIAFLSIQLDDFLPAAEVAEAMLQFSRQMSWEKVSVIYAEDEYSLAITRAIDQKAETSGICFESYTKVTDNVMALNGDTNTTGFLVVSPPEDAQNITRLLLTAEKQRHYQWMFSHPWSAEETNLLEDLSVESDVYALAVSPVMVKLFEQYWNNRKNPSMEVNPENYWTLEFLANLKKCHLETIPTDPKWLPCHNFNVAETPLASVLSHSRIIPAVHALNTFAYALRTARNIKCNREKGYCNKLRMMTRQEFLQDIFNSMEVRHNGPGNRVPDGFVGSKKMSSNKIAEVKISLIRPIRDNNSTGSIQELMSYQKDSGLRVINESFVSRSITCPSDGCSYCVYFQRGVPVNKAVSVMNQPQLPTSIPAQAQTDHVRIEPIVIEEESNGEWRATVHKVENIDLSFSEQSLSVPHEQVEGRNSLIIPALFPVHRAGPTPLQCSAEIDPEAIQNIEAFLWGLDLVNANAWLLNGLDIGTVIFDTCSSPIKAAHLVSSVMAKEDDDMLHEINIDPKQLLTVVSATTAQETDAVVSVLAPNDVTTISAIERSSLDMETPYRLQVAVSVNEAAKVLVDLLRYYGWNDVSVVYSSRDADSVAGFRRFQQLADTTSICIGWVEKMNDTRSVQVLDHLFDQLVTQMEMGSRVVILWTDAADTEAILTGTDLLTPEFVNSHKESIVWIDANGWITDPKLQNLVNYVGTWLAIRTEQNLVKEFTEHLAKLRPETNDRNPWYREFWEQMENCQTDCPSMKQIHRSTTNVIQSVYAVASGLARLMEEYCSNQRLFTGLCSTNSSEFRQMFFGYMKMTGTDRPDCDAEEEFAFNEDGYGDTPLQVVHIRADFPAEAATKVVQIATYKHGKLQVTNQFNGFSYISECNGGDKGKSACAGCIAKQHNQMLMQRSRDQLYILGLFDVHEKSADDIWSCGSNITSQGIQQTEAFLWALNHVNSNPEVLPGVELGAIGLDGCGTPQKRTTALASLFSPEIHQSQIDRNQIVSLVVASPDIDSRILHDLHQRQGMAILLSAPSNDLTPAGMSPLIQLSPTIPLIARALTSLLHRINILRVSLLCSTELLPYSAICEELRYLSLKSNLTLAMNLSVRPRNHSVEYWVTAAAEVTHQAQQGVDTLVVLLPDNQLSHLLSAIDPSKTPPLVLIALSTQEYVNDQFAGVLSNVISLRMRSSQPGRFYDDMKTSMIQLNGTNPWLNQFWMQQLQCRGAACLTMDKKHIQSMNEMMDHNDETVVNTINGVMAVAQALERMRKDMCPELDQGLCPAMTTGIDFRTRLERSIMEHSFRDINGQLTTFDKHNGWNQGTTIDIENTHYSAEGMKVHPLGVFSPLQGISIDLTDDLVRSVTSNPLVTSVWQPTQFMRIPAGIENTNSGFWIAGLLPFHRRGLEPLSCGIMHSDRVFQNLAAIAMVLGNQHANSTIPTALHIGAVLFDSCSHTDRAQHQISSILSSKLDSPSNPIVDSKPIGVITFDIETAQTVDETLNKNNIAQFTTAIDGFRNLPVEEVYPVGNQWHSVSGRRMYQTVPTDQDEVDAIYEIVTSLGWKYVVLFYDDSPTGLYQRDLFLGYVRINDICVGAQIRVSKFPPADPTHLKSLLTAIANDLPELSVAVFLLDTPAQVLHVISILEEIGLSQQFLVVSNHAWGNHHKLLFESSTRQLAGVLSVSMETYSVPEFDLFLSNLTLATHSSIPHDWFEEYFQHHFECRLTESHVVQTMYTEECVGTERFQLDSIEQDPYVYHTVQAVNTYLTALDQFLRFHCTAGMEAKTLGDCGPQSTERFGYILNDVVKRRQLQGSSSGVGGLNIWNAQQQISTSDPSSEYTHVGIWRRGSPLHLDKTKMKFYVSNVDVPTVECWKGACRSVCSAQSSQSSTSFRPAADQDEVLEVRGSYNPAWSAVATIICVIGLTAVVACITYLIRSPDNMTPSSVLNYIILSGITLLYVATIASLITPNDGWCGARRFLPGVAYAAIFAGLLVRAVHNWRRPSVDHRNGDASLGSETSSRAFNLNDDATRPTGLVLTALTLVAVQVVLLSAWLMFRPPLAAPTAQGLWRCMPVDSFESQLVLSLILPIILLFAATVFSMLAMRSSDTDRDSRSMMACCALVSFTTACWTLVATQAPFPFREPAIIVGNILSAKFILLILYGRKVYQISTSRQESRNLAVLSQFTRRRPKTLQPTLQGFATTRSLTAMYATDLDGPCSSRNESFTIESEGASQNMDLSSSGLNSSEKLSRNFVKRSHSFQGHSLSSCRCLNADRQDMFAAQVVPHPIYPMPGSYQNNTLVEETGREYSDPEEVPVRYRSNSLPQSRRGSSDLSDETHQPIVRRVGSRQMLVLGDDISSIHGRVSKI